MRTIGEILDAAKARHGLASDYKLGLFLGVGLSNLSNWRKGRSLPDATMCARLAAALDEDPLPLIAEIESQRAVSPETADLWRAMWERLTSPAAAKIAVLLTIVFAAFQSGALDAYSGYTVTAALDVLHKHRIDLALLIGVSVVARLASIYYRAWIARRRLTKP